MGIIGLATFPFRLIMWCMSFLQTAFIIFIVVMVVMNWSEIQKVYENLTEKITFLIENFTTILSKIEEIDQKINDLSSNVPP